MWKFIKERWKTMLIISLLPFGIMFLMHIGLALGYYFGFNISVNGIENKDWFAFWGSYLGGIATLIALYITIESNKKMIHFQGRTTYLNDEKKNISNAISKINTLVANSILEQYRSIPIDNGGHNAHELCEIKKKISFEREKIVEARNILTLTADILDIYSDCTVCNDREKCLVRKYRTEFSDIYYRAEKIIYEALALLEQFIDSNSNNLKHTLSINRAENLLKEITDENYKQELIVMIEDFNKYLIDDKALSSELANKCAEISKLHLEDKTNLIYNAKAYYFARCDDLSKKCFSVNKSNLTNAKMK